MYPHRLVFLTPRLINEKTPRNVRMWLELIADSWTIRLMKPITICQSFKGLSRILNGVQFRPKS